MDLMKVGADWGGAGTFKPFTSTISGAQRASNAHGAYMDPTMGGRIFSGGGGLVVNNNATFALGTLGATATPIFALWNPLNSRRYLNLLQVKLCVVMTAAQATGPGGFVWAFSRGNAALTLGTTPWDRSTLDQSGSVAKFFASGAALTGLTNSLVVAEASALGGGSAGNYAFLATQVAMQTQLVANVEYFEGSVVVPPGGLIALLSATTTVAHSTMSAGLWEEVPLLVSV